MNKEVPELKSPLTPGQSRLWVENKLLLGSATHPQILILELTDALDEQRLKKACLQTLQAHDVFSIILDPEEPRQNLVPSIPEIQVINLSKGRNLSHWLLEQSEIVQAKNDLLPKLFLVKTSDTLALILRFSPVILDEPSLGLLIQDISRRYTGTPGTTETKFLPYLLEGKGSQLIGGSPKDHDAWIQKLVSPPPPGVLLGASLITAPIKALKTHTVNVSEENQYRLQNFSHPLDYKGLNLDPLSLALCTITFAWIFRLSGQNDIVLSALKNMRDGKYLSTLGFFQETYFLRVTIDPEETFLTLLEKVSQEYQFIHAHPTSVPRDGGFTSAILQNIPTWPRSFCGQPMKIYLHKPGNNALNEPSSPRGAEIQTISYNVDSLGGHIHMALPQILYSDAEQIRLVAYFERLLSIFLNSPSTLLRDAEIVGTHETAHLQSLCRGAAPPAAPDLLSVLAHQVKNGPESPAVEFEGEILTYGELERITNRLARRLQASGVTTHTRVAIALPRGFGEFTAMVSVMKAGGAYVPLDLSHPVERVRVILEDAKPQIFITHPGSVLQNSLPPGVSFLELEDPRTSFLDLDDTPLQITTQPNDPAYIIFTSGSTGRPKGVEISRGSLANFLQSMEKKPGITPGDRLLALSTTTFDMSVLDFFLPLYSGATVIIATKDDALDPNLLHDLLIRSQANILQATPATWRLLTGTGWKGNPGFKIFSGGEALNPSLANLLLEGGAELWNLYGPTETTVYSTLKQIKEKSDRITVGSALDHTTITLRDPQGRLVPQGTIGEICIHGRGLALGYFGREDLTSEKFKLDPHTGDRYYTTGDLGRFLPNEELECLGRVDHQVKIRGFRIELGDIETQLRTIPGVDDVLVIAIKDSQGDASLAVYWVGIAEKQSLYEGAKNLLPPYMVPSAYLRLESFPLNTNGKIDRKKLPSADVYQENISSQDLPRNDQETIIASLWREILGLDVVSINQDFFSLGGTSISAIQLQRKLKETFQMDISLRSLFEYPTIQGIVSHLGSTDSPDIPLVSRLSRGGDSPPWIGLMGIHLFAELAMEFKDNYGLLAMHAPVRFTPGIDPFPSIKTVAQKYVETIKLSQPEGPYFLVGLCYGGLVAYEAANILQSQGDQVPLVVLLDSDLPSGRKIKIFSYIRFGLFNLLIRKWDSFKKWMTPGRLKSTPTLTPESLPLPPEPMDLPLDDPEIEKDMVKYESGKLFTDTTILVFRATRTERAPWIEVKPDMGWSGKGKKVIHIDIDSDHLGILQGSAVVTLSNHMKDIRKAMDTI